MDGLELLKSDHERVNSLFDRIEQAGDLAEKRRLFLEIKQELDLHAHVEETVLYPMFENREGFRDTIEDSYDEHQEVKDLLEEMSGTEDEDELDDQVDELIELVQHHVEEEEGDLFPRIRQALGQPELDQLGQQLQDAKKSMPSIAA